MAKGGRHSDWSRETLLREMRQDSRRSVISICRQYALKGQNPKRLEREVERWRREEEFREEYDDLMQARRSSLVVSSADTVQPGWRKAFVKKYLQTASKRLAAKSTPFQKLDSINQRLDEKHELYDPEFAEMFENAQQSIVDEAEATVVEALRDEALTSLQRANLAFKFLQVRDAKWSPKIQQTIQGKVNHDHKHGLDDKMVDLFADQKAFFNKSPDQLIEAQFVEVTDEAGGDSEPLALPSGDRALGGRDVQGDPEDSGEGAEGS